MLEATTTSRPVRKRSTHAVVSDMEHIERWWAPQQPATPSPTAAESKSDSSRHEIRFRNGNLNEPCRWFTYAIATVSLIIPAILVLRLDGAQNTIRKFLFNPRAAAQQSLAQGRLADAIAPLRLAVAASPNDSMLLRQLALVCAEPSPAEARAYYNRIEQLGATTNEDRAAHASLLALLHDFCGAKAVISKVTSEGKTSPTVQRAWLAVWRESGDFPAAVSILDQLAATSGTDALDCLALFESASRGTCAPAILQRIEVHLAKTLSQDVEQGRLASWVPLAPRLTALSWRSAEGRTTVARLLRVLPGSPAEYRMAAVRLQFDSSVSGSEREGLRRAWMDELTACGGLSAESKDRVASYLQQQGEHDLVVEIISAPEALTEVPLYRRRVESMLELGLWREVGTMGAEDAAPTLPDSRLLIRSLSALCKPGPNKCMADRMLADAFTESLEEKRPSACFTTGCAALDQHLPVLASQAFATALNLSKDRRTMMESIINHSRGSSLSISQLLSAIDGSPATYDETVQHQLIYLHVLADRDLDAMNDLIRNRRALAPDDVYMKFLDAFVTNKRGGLTQAASMLVPLPRYRWHQGEAAVIASIIGAAGNFDRVAPLISQIETSKLFPQEQALVLPLQQRLAIAGNLVSAAGTP